MKIYNEEKQVKKEWQLKLEQCGDSVNVLAVNEFGERIACLLEFRDGSKILYRYDYAAEAIENYGYDLIFKFDDEGRIITEPTQQETIGFYKNSYDKVKTEAINHYIRMIKWAMNENLNSTPDCALMYAIIKETWHAEDCPYCSAYQVSSCIKCPLRGSNNAADTCCNGKWKILAHSSVWGIWIKNALDVLQYIVENG